MGFSKLWAPGLGLMRHLSFGAKFALIAILAALPLLFVLWQVAVGDGAKPGLTSVLALCAMAVLLIYFLVALYQSVTQDLGVVVTAVDRMVAGDLRQALSPRGQDELARLVGTVGQLGRTVSAMVANVRSNAAFVNHAGKSLARGNSDLSDRTEQQAANLEQTAASVEELSSTVQENASTASRANGKASEVRDVADDGAATMAQAVESVEAIQSSAKRMDEIVGVIDGLAFQTNILALNAAVEAARAGESGRGFAVVATEVRSLAQRSAEASKEIRLLISASSSQVAASVEKIRAAGTTINQVVIGIRDVAASMSLISTSSAEQSSGLSEITAAVRQLVSAR
jgi:methyl-accepting chemotaxis protein